MDVLEIKQIELNLFTANYVDHLHRQLENDNMIKKYQEDTFSSDPEFPRGSSGILLDSDFKLDPGKNDIENSIHLYENLDLNPTEASDQRLWTYLTHVLFWDYMRSRWPVERRNNKIEFIGSRYFLRGLNLQNLVRNGISRLWWFVHISVDETREDIYELTRVLLSRADLTVGITERAFGTNRNICFAILEFLKDHPEVMNDEDKTRELLVSLNLVGGVKNLPFLNISEIKEILDHVRPV